MPTGITVKGLDELLAKMRAFPDKLNAAIKSKMDDALLVLWENVPAYPPYPDPLGKGSSYIRKGTLGRTLGSSEGGGKGGAYPDIYEVHPLGSASGYEGRFGTNLDYAPYVIDPVLQSKRLGYWWTMTTIAEKAHDKIVAVFQGLADELRKFLEG